MALTLDDVEKLMRACKLKYFKDPERPVLMFPATGAFGTYQFIVLLDVEGTFLQFRTINYLHCPPDHPYNHVVLKVMGEMNYRRRTVKFGWDPTDGEIVAYADLWVMDTAVTQAQFERMLSSFMPGVDMGSERIKRTMETGKDPGDIEAEKVLEEAGKAGGALPPDVRELLEKLRGKPGSGPKGKSPEISEI
jgi:hypothetical protein